MALWDSADLLARCKVLAARDKLSADASMTDANWYDFLTAAEAWWKPILAAEYPYHMFAVPTKLTTSDGGITYVFPSETAPLAVEVYPSLTSERMIVGQFGDPNADYVWEGSLIRMPTNTARTFSDGPYGRWVASPATINATTQPTLAPAYTRQLLVDRAVILWASRGGLRDPTPFERLESQLWAKLQEALKNSNPFYGDAANRQRSRARGINYLLARRA